MTSQYGGVDTGWRGCAGRTYGPALARQHGRSRVMVPVYLALADLAGAKTLVQEIDEVLQRRPDPGTLVGEVRPLRDRLTSQRGSTNPGASALTIAGLRLLPPLSTHLSFPEIAAELFVSRNTIKSQVLSIYRKLGASSGNNAVGRAHELGLLEG